MKTITLELVEARHFYCAIAGAPKPWMLTPYTYRDFQNMAGVRFYLVSNHSAGFAIRPDGESICLFNGSGIRGLGRILKAETIRPGATYVFCFDGYLTKFNKEFGFVEYKREKFDPELAPSGWPDDTRPDLVYMKPKRKE